LTPLASGPVFINGCVACIFTVAFGSAGADLVGDLGQGGVQLGQYVAGLPMTGPVYVSSTSNIANSNVTISFPLNGASS
jgi:hypothetical protein